MLPAPVDSDTFSSSDFTDAFTKIDNAPGVTTVANYAALTALPWGTAQHGLKAIQLDNLAEWIWINPSGSGTFKRTNSLGLLKQVAQGSDVSTNATTGLGVRAVHTGNVTAAGGRSWYINAYLGLDNDSGSNGMVAVNLTDNGASIKYAGYRAGAPHFVNGNHTSLDWFITPSAGSVHDIGIYIRSDGGSIANGGHGTSSARECLLTIVEV